MKPNNIDTLEFPFASLDFPDRSTLTAEEVAEAANVTAQHIRDLLSEETIGSFNAGGTKNKSDREYRRVPIECYRDWILSTYKGPAVGKRLCGLKDRPLMNLYNDIKDELEKRGYEL